MTFSFKKHGRNLAPKDPEKALKNNLLLGLYIFKSYLIGVQICSCLFFVIPQDSQQKGECFH